MDLERAELKAALDSEEFFQGLTASPLSWEDTREANRAMRGYAVRIGQGLVGRWEEATDWQQAS